MNYLIDTNVLSEMRKIAKHKADPQVTNWARGVVASELFTSAVVIYELELGIQLLANRDSHAANVLRIWLDSGVIPTFADRILSIDASIAKVAAGYSNPQTTPFRDSLIAATASVHNLTVVTRNLSDFERFPSIRTLNPWD